MLSTNRRATGTGGFHATTRRGSRRAAANPLSGGFDQAFDYAGHGDYCMLADGGTLGVHDGLYLKLRAEHRYGPTIVGNVGCFISPTLIADLPVYDGEEVYLTNVLLTQEVSDAFSVFAGKMDTLDGGMLLSVAVRVPTSLFDRPGHQLLGGTWNSRTYTSIAEAYIPYPDVATPTIRGSWCLYWNFDQYLFVDPADGSRGWGPFGRAGIADPATSPIDAFLSVGLGGNVPSASRPTCSMSWRPCGPLHRP